MRTREFIKGLALLPILVGILVGGLAWSLPGVGLGYRLAGPLLFFLGIGMFLGVHLQKDRAPDYLGRLFGSSFFDRGGFCFAVRPMNRGSACDLRVYFQNRYEGRQRGRLALRPKRGLFKRPPAEPRSVGAQLECGPGAFGYVDIPLLEPPDGEVIFEVGASVDYPEGRGRTLRYRDGIVLRANEDFEDSFTDAIAVAGTLTGHIVLASPATVTLRFSPPEGTSSESRSPEPRVFWEAGQPPLDEAALHKHASGRAG